MPMRRCSIINVETITGSFISILQKNLCMVTLDREYPVSACNNSILLACTPHYPPLSWTNDEPTSGFILKPNINTSFYFSIT